MTWLAAACWRDGDWTAALTHAHAAVELAQETGWATEEPQALAILATVEAGLGMEAACREHAGRALRLGADTGMRIVEARAEHALGLLELGAGRPDVAVGHLSVTAEFALAHGLGSPVLLEWAGDLVEAHVRAGTPERARRALAVLEREAAAPGRPLADAVVLRCSALLLGDDEAAGPAFARGAAPARRGRARPFEEARTRLCLGEHLRRRRRLGAAREALAAARRGFVRLGATAWVERADAELRVAGTRPVGRSACGGRVDHGTCRSGGGRARRRTAPRTGAPAAHPAGAAGGTRRRRRGDQRRGRRPAVPVAEDDRVPPVERLPQARDPLAGRARAGRAVGLPGIGLTALSGLRRRVEVLRQVRRGDVGRVAVEDAAGPLEGAGDEPGADELAVDEEGQLLPVSIDRAMLTVESRL